ncbi:MAG: hypothetical protein LBV74_09610 [Tannerella sp.]|nr:hypothetical protein [Tannerella sp.]
MGKKPFLIELICQRNQLDMLNVSECNSLMELDCGYNSFSGTALNDLFETLHSNSLPEKKIIDLGYDNPDTFNFSIPHSKGWLVYPFDEYGEYEEDEEIEGDE